MIVIAPSATAVIEALGHHRPGYVWLPKGLQHVLELFPETALACALAEHGVWDLDKRDEFMKAASREKQSWTHSTGIRADSFYVDVLDEAYKRGEGFVSETDVASALAKHWGPMLAQVGVDTDALVNVTEYHETNQKTMQEQLAKSRRRLLQQATSARALRALLVPSAEAQGWVDWKRSLDHDRRSLEATIVALVNANPLSPVHVVFGVEDDGTVVGQVDGDLNPMDERRAAGCRDAIEKRLAGTDPMTIIRWKRLEQGDKVLWVLSALGRDPGTIARTSDGRFPMRSGGQTRYLRALDIVNLLRRPSFLSQPPQ